jgi:hypothetical protein
MNRYERLQQRAGQRKPLACKIVFSFSLLLLLPASPKAQSSVPCVQARDERADIRVSPNMLVSRDGDIPHVELMIAANPKDSKNFLGASITNARPDGGWTDKTYASLDGGSTWTASDFPEGMKWGSGDPQVAFGSHGTAYFVGLTSAQDDAGRARGFLFFYRSGDGGITWDKPVNLGYSYDHEQIVVDDTLGTHSGRVYLGALYGYPVYRIGVFRSDDDGRTLTGPVEAANGGGNVGINVTNLLVFSDGTLFVPYADFDFKPEERKHHRPSSFWFVTSSDGAVTFSKPSKIAEQRTALDTKASWVTTFPVYAVDNQSDKYRDRLYLVWNDFRFGKSRILFSESKDRGTSWTEPRALDSSGPASSVQYQPMASVNSQGVLGVTWFDTRNSQDGSKYDEYFAASVDGGETFLSAVRVSSESSQPEGRGNQSLSPVAGKSRPMPDLTGTNRIGLVSAVSRWRQGGDYMGLTASSKGVFHPFWADSRSGTFQIETAAIQVKVPDEKPGEEPQERKAESHSKSPTDVGDRVEFVFDPTRYDAEARELQLPVRLKNTSQQTIYGPITVTVQGFGSGMGKESVEFSPEILNATNGKTGEGALFEYSDVLGSECTIPPSGTSGALTWKLKLLDPKQTPDLHMAVEGFLPAEP